MKKVEVEGPLFHLRIKPGLSAEQRGEIAHEICRFLVDPPRLQDELRRVVVRTAMAQYEGSRTARAKELADRYKSYLASGWLRERGLETLPEPRSVERVCLHRLARLNNGRSLGRRQLDRIAGPL